MAPDELDRAKLYLELANRAWLRVSSRRDVEWKAAFGIWTFFGAATYAVLTSTAAMHTHPVRVFAGALVATAFIVGLYRCTWQPYVAAATQRDMRTQYFWESGIQNILGMHLPPRLKPESDRSGLLPWEDMPDDGQPDQNKPITPEDREALRTLHTAQECQFYITFLIGAMFLGAVWLKTFALVP